MATAIVDSFKTLKNIVSPKKKVKRTLSMNPLPCYAPAPSVASSSSGGSIPSSSLTISSWNSKSSCGAVLNPVTTSASTPASGKGESGGTADEDVSMEDAELIVDTTVALSSGMAAPMPDTNQHLKDHPVVGRHLADILEMKQRNSTLEHKLEVMLDTINELKAYNKRIASERDDLQQTWRSQKHEITGIIREREEELERKSKYTVYLEEELANLQRSQEKMKRTMDETRKELQEQRNVTTEQQRKFEVAHRQVLRERDAAKEGVSVWEGRGKEMRDRIAEMEKENEGMRALLKTRTEELELARTFMTTADEYSVADVKRQVELLNDELWQNSVTIAEEVVKLRKPRKEDESAGAKRRWEDDRKAAVKKWGEEMVTQFLVEIQKNETTLLECMILNVLVLWCSDLSRPFRSRTGRETAILEAVWCGISDSHNPTIARKWFSMTHSQLKSAKIDDSEAVRDLTRLLDLAGVSKRESDALKLVTSIRDKVKDVTAKALKIEDMCIEGILSLEINVFSAANGDLYDRAVMEDGFSGGRGDASGEQRVVCATGLGLAGRTLGEGKDANEEILVKPVVLLASALAE